MARAGSILPLTLLLLASCARPYANAPGSGGDRGMPVGLEVTWWIVDDALQPAKEPLAEVLGDYADRELPGAGAARELWRANGLRVLAVPVPELEIVRARLSISGPVHEQWLGILSDWTPIISGPAVPEPFSVRLDSGSLGLPPGRLRLLARAWPTPVEPAPSEPLPSDGRMPALLELEILPQHAQDAPRDPLGRAMGARAPGVLDQGQPFSRLTLTLLSRGKDAILIVPTAPADDWPDASKARPSASASAGGWAGPGGPEVPGETPLHALGPTPSPSPSLGQLMLSDPAHPLRRGVLVLIPHAPERFELGR